MKKVVKLSRQQLRGLINEAIMQKPLGQPEGVWINEAPKRTEGEGLSSFELADDVAQKLRKHWADSFDEGDPSQAAAGKKAWEAQCDSAAEAILNEVAIIIDKVEERLISGEFYNGGGGMFEMDEDDDVKLPPMHPKSRNNGHHVADEPEAPRGYSGGHEDADLPPMHPRGRR